MLKQKNQKESLGLELDSLKSSMGDQIEELLVRGIEMERENASLQEELKWIHNKHRTLELHFQREADKNKQLQHQQVQQTSTIAIMEESFRKIKKAYAEKSQEILTIETQSLKEERIREKYSERLRLKYLREVIVRGSLWQRVRGKEEKSKRRRDTALMAAAFGGLRGHLMREKRVKRMEERRNDRLLRHYFKELLLEKLISSKQIHIVKMVKAKEARVLFRLLKVNEGIHKERQLKSIWAGRHFSEVSCLKGLNSLKRTYAEGK